MAISNKNDRNSMSINNAVSTWNLGTRAVTKVTETHLSRHVGKSTEALSVEEAVNVLKTHAKDKEESENFSNLVQAKVEKTWNQFIEQYNDGLLSVKEISTVGKDLQVELKSFNNWLTLFTLGMLPGVNEKGFVVAGEKYSRNIYTMYNATCYSGQFVFPELDQVPYDPALESGITCFYSADSQKLAQKLVMERFRPSITTDQTSGHLVLSFGEIPIRKFVERELVTGATLENTVIKFDGLFKMKVGD